LLKLVCQWLSFLSEMLFEHGIFHLFLAGLHITFKITFYHNRLDLKAILVLFGDGPSTILVFQLPGFDFHCMQD